MIDFRVLGGLELRADDGRELHSLLAQPKRVALLSYLCIARPHGFHRRDKLLGLLWPEADQAHSRNSLRNALHVLRRSLGPNAILSRGDEDVCADPAVVTCDALQFGDALQHGAADEAVRLYRGDLMPGFFIGGAPEFERWVETERDRFREMAGRAARLSAERLAAGGNWSGAVRAARHAAELTDSDERVIRRLIELLDSIGDRAGALRVYTAFSERLASDYAISPSRETQALVARVRAELSSAAPSPRQPAGAPTTPHQPPAGRPTPEITGYVIERELGRGGMATVYLAHDLKHERLVAIKLLRPEVSALIGTSRFLAEIGIAAQLQHQHIVPLFDSGTTGDLPYYVMPFVEGESLREILTNERKVGIDAALRIVREVAEALDHAHARGIVHRDVKPENILIANGHAMVADFGVAHAIATSARDDLASTDFVVGTPRYTSPELASGGGPPSAQSDVYSLGRILDEMLAGSAPPMLDRVIRRALATAPAERFASAGELAARATSAAARGARRRLAVTAAVAAIITILGAATSALLMPAGVPKPQETNRRQLTFAGNPTMAAIAPDGRTIAYAVPDGDSESVVVQGAAGGEIRKILVVPVVNTIEWSPDGTQLLVGSDNRAIVLPRAGGPGRPVPLPARFEIVVQAYWLPDGSRVSVHANLSRRIVVIDLRSGDTTAISIRGEYAMFEGAWSPDGEAFALSTADSTGWQIRILQPDGRAAIAVSDSVGLHSPRWAPDGHALFYVRRDDSIWRIRISPQTHRPVGGTQAVHRFLEMLPNTNDRPMFSISSDGRSMVYARGARFANLWMIDQAVKGMFAPPVQLTTGTLRRWAPAVSPDGRWVAFVQAGDGSADLYRIPIEGGTPIRVTAGADVTGASIAWSPDQRQIAFAARRRGGAEVMIADVISGRLREAGAHHRTGGAITWAPGTRIAYQTRLNRNIELLDPVTGVEQALLPDDTTAWVFSPRYAPDGVHLAVNVNLRGGDFGVSIFDLRDRSSRRVSTPIMYPRGWSGDGRFVYAMGLRRIYRVAAADIAPPQQIVPLPWRSPDCTSAGPLRATAFICSAADYTSDVWLVEDFDARAPGG